MPGTVKSLAAPSKFKPSLHRIRSSRYLPHVTEAGTKVGPVWIQIDPSPLWFEKKQGWKVRIQEKKLEYKTSKTYYLKILTSINLVKKFFVLWPWETLISECFIDFCFCLMLKYCSIRDRKLILNSIES